MRACVWDVQLCAVWVWMWSASERDLESLEKNCCGWREEC